eukprot:9472957-Pyramimonas_sp.AAC.2
MRTRMRRGQPKTLDPVIATSGQAPDISSHVGEGRAGSWRMRNEEGEDEEFVLCSDHGRSSIVGASASKGVRAQTVEDSEDDDQMSEDGVEPKVQWGDQATTAFG